MIAREPRARRRARLAISVSFLGALATACGGSEFTATATSNGSEGGASNQNDSGTGMSSAGGASGKGGAGSGAGGAAHGGHVGAGGAAHGGSPTGGNVGAGGAPSDGGQTGSGGTNDTGGGVGSGGVPSTGGLVGRGGVVGAGGGIIVGTGGKIGAGGTPGAGGGLGAGGIPGSGGITGAGGIPGTGGIINIGGVTGAGGFLGAGGVPVLCTPGALQCDHQPSRRCVQGVWQNYTCGPLMLADISGIDVTKLPGFGVPLRCESLSVCGVSQDCVYFSQTLGSVQSSDPTYTDGLSLADPQAVKISIGIGAASQCVNPAVDINGGESILVSVSNGSGMSTVRIFFPAFQGQSLMLYVREDGATFYDAGFTQLAHAAG